MQNSLGIHAALICFAGLGSFALGQNVAPLPGPSQASTKPRPVVKIAAPIESQVCSNFVPMNFTLSASAIDPRDGDVSALIEWTDTILGSAPTVLGKGGTILYSPPCASHAHIIQASVTNTTGVQSAVGFTFEIQYSPVVRITSQVSGTQLPCPVTVQFAGKAQDAEGDISYKISWNEAGTGVFGVGPVAVRSYGCNEAGVHQPWITVVDRFGTVAVNAVDFTVGQRN